ncbi:STAS/SEC14 domain-containing protein [Actinomycetospora lutea]|uniref:STAS/SEC14 domain-containing protein n=1 Tax=Actinomycetospora lutea TaxID=663604 RepID=UPI002366CA74|nr:STAS/SEC14 domain-containing protein [Actinomycetospora lutea]MDD7939590.1 STAS/SEC14 domain-containing protein [Actinomycetospora lutea]
MLETVPDVPAGITAIEAVGTITAEDYAEIVGPLLEDAHAEGRRLRILLHLGPRYEGFTAGAVWEKAGVWMRHPGLWHEIAAYALVSDIRWVGDLVHLAGVLLPFPMRVFGDDAFDEAVAWLESLPEHPGDGVASGSARSRSAPGREP